MWTVCFYRLTAKAVCYAARLHWNLWELFYFRVSSQSTRLTEVHNSSCKTYLLVPSVKCSDWCSLRYTAFHWSLRKRFLRAVVWFSIQGGKSVMLLDGYRTSQAFIELISWHYAFSASCKKSFLQSSLPPPLFTLFYVAVFLLYFAMGILSINLRF